MSDRNDRNMVGGSQVRFTDPLIVIAVNPRRTLRPGRRGWFTDYRSEPAERVADPIARGLAACPNRCSCSPMAALEVHSRRFRLAGHQDPKDGRSSLRRYFFPTVLKDRHHAFETELVCLDVSDHLLDELAVGRKASL